MDKKEHPSDGQKQVRDRKKLEESWAAHWVWTSDDHRFESAWNNKLASARLELGSALWHELIYPAHFIRSSRVLSRCLFSMPLWIYRIELSIEWMKPVQLVHVCGAAACCRPPPKPRIAADLEPQFPSVNEYKIGRLYNEVGLLKS